MTRMVCIGEVAEVIRGVTYDRDSVQDTPGNDALALLRGGNIQDQLILNEGLVWVPRRLISDKQVLRQNDLVMCTSSGSADVLGKTALFEDDRWRGSCGAFCAVVRADPMLCYPAFLKHILRSRAFLNWARSSLGANIKNIRKSELEKFRFTLPARIEQQRIATILDKADNLRRKRQEAIRLSENFLRASFFHSFGDSEVNAMDWPVVRLEDVALQVTDGEHQTPRRSHEGIYLLSARNIQNGHLDLGDVDYVPLDEFERIRRRCEPRRGDILVSCSGSIGRVAQVTIDEPMALVRSVALVRPNKEKIRSSFLEHLLRSVPMQRRMIAASKSSAQANLFQGPIRALPVMLPPMEEQIRFEKIVERVALLSVKFDAAMSEVVDLASSLQWQYFNKASCS